MTTLLYLAAFVPAFFPLGQAQVPQATLVVTENVQLVYRQGEEGNIDLTITLSDTAETVGEGVLFLNIVERDAAQTWPQAAHLIFASAREKESVFRIPFTGQALREGLTTSLAFKLRDHAKVGEYALVVQLYKGSETNPNRVKPEHRLSMQGFDFSVVER